MPASDSRYRAFALVAVAIAAVTVATYVPVGKFGFILKDDGEYVLRNSHVQEGFTRESVAWALTAFKASNWHPLTWLSHALDVRLFGLDPGWHHRVNLTLHVLNAVLLLAVLHRATGALWTSAVVAALFAVHPLHVESVAWIAERKDLLSSLFWILCMGAYLRYVHRPSIRWYLPVFVCLALGLMAKQMLVTLPLVLLLLDYWPLGRMGPDGTLTSRAGLRRLAPLVIEKIPLFILAGLASGAALLAQSRGGALGSLEQYPLPDRIANALNSYGAYLLHTLMPMRLAFFYPFPEGGYSAARTLALALALVLASALVLRAARRFPFLAVGWVWYLVTLVPVLGLVQIGRQAMADRYTYMPLTGIFVAAAWGIAELSARWKIGKAWLALVGCLVVVLLAGTARTQTMYWKDDLSLLRHDVEVVERHFDGYVKLASALFLKQDLSGAEKNYREALKIRPNEASVRNNLGTVLYKQGRIQESLQQFRLAVEANPDYPLARKNLESTERMLRASPSARDPRLPTM